MRRLVPITLFVFLVVTANAAAASLVAGPDGTGGKCTGKNPCAIEKAIKKADDGDRVQLQKGVYALSKSVTVKAKISIQAVNPEKRPVVITDGDSTFGVLLDRPNTSISDITFLTNAQGASLVGKGGKLNRVQVTNFSGVACYFEGSVKASNTSCVGLGGVGFAVVATGGNDEGRSTLTNDTFIGIDGSGYGLVAGATPHASQAVRATNTIALGEGFDVYGVADNPGSVTVRLRSSAYESTSVQGSDVSITDPSGAGNVTDDPLFANPGIAEFHQLIGSPTIDAGRNNAPHGAFDVDHKPRVIGGTVDIGADEYGN